MNFFVVGNYYSNAGVPLEYLPKKIPDHLSLDPARSTYAPCDAKRITDVKYFENKISVECVRDGTGNASLLMSMRR